MTHRLLCTAAAAASLLLAACPIVDPTDPTPCADNGDCCFEGPNSVCVAGACQSTASCAQDPACHGSRFGACGPSPDPCGNGVCEGDEATTCPADCEAGACPTFAIGARPFGPPPFACNLPPGPITLQTVGQLEALWHSDITACPCEADAFANGCQMNAFVNGNGPGYIFYDAGFLAALSGMAGNDIAGQWILSHEAGHVMQIALGIRTQFQIQLELGADCFSGYYLGSRVCGGTATESDVMTAIGIACRVGDPMGLPWFDPRAHGDCQMRASAVQAGLQAYRAGTAPQIACRL